MAPRARLIPSPWRSKNGSSLRTLSTRIWGSLLASNTEAYAGHLSRARELTISSAMRADSNEDGAIWQENAALREAAFGNSTEARREAAAALKLAPASQAVESEAALAFAMADDRPRAEYLAQDLNKRFPLDTQIQSVWLPPSYAQLALGRRRPADAAGLAQAPSQASRSAGHPGRTSLATLPAALDRGTHQCLAGKLPTLSRALRPLARDLWCFFFISPASSSYIGLCNSF
jgi:hypothetical protein